MKRTLIIIIICLFTFSCERGWLYKIILGNCIGDDVELWGECYPINLTELDLVSNKLSGEIPSAIGTLINLTRLRLDNNQLVGEIPLEIGNLVNLEYLHLNDNQLNGVIPIDICNLPVDFDGENEWGSSYFEIYNNQFCPSYPYCLTAEDVGVQDCNP